MSSFTQRLNVHDRSRSRDTRLFTEAQQARMRAMIGLWHNAHLRSYVMYDRLGSHPSLLSTSDSGQGVRNPMHCYCMQPRGGRTFNYFKGGLKVVSHDLSSNGSYLHGFNPARLFVLQNG